MDLGGGLGAHERRLALGLHAALEEMEEYVYGEKTPVKQQDQGRAVGRADGRALARPHHGTGGPQGGAARPLSEQAAEWAAARPYLRARGRAILRQHPSAPGEASPARGPSATAGQEETFAEHYDGGGASAFVA